MNLLKLSLIFCLCLVVSACGNGNGQAEAEPLPLPEVEVLTVGSSLQRNFSVTGEVEALRQARITGQFRARIEQVPVVVGDTVEVGDTLLVLSAPEVLSDFRTAQAQYTAAEQNLVQTRVNNQKNIESARIALATAETNVETLLKSNAAKKTQATETRNTAEINRNLNIGTAQTSFENGLISARIAANNAIFDMDEILEVSNDRDDLSFVQETHIGVRDPIQREQARSAIEQIMRLEGQVVNDYESIARLLSEVEKRLELTLLTLQNSITSVKYPESVHDSNINIITGHLATVRTSITSIEGNKRALESAEMMADNNQSQTLIDAQAALDTTLAELEASEANARRQVEQAQINLETAIASARVSEVTAQANLANVGGSLSSARIEQDKLIIEAPFAGTVSNVPVVEGDEVVSGTPLVTLEDTSATKLVAFLSEREVATVSVGDDVTLETGENVVVASVSPSADPETKKFKVELQSLPENLRLGSFVRLNFTSENNGESRLFVPVTAVHIEATSASVWLLQSTASGTVVASTVITLGNIEGSNVEVLSGLEPGDQVVSHGGRRLSAGDQVTVTN